jgi:hypothetical protein
MQSVQDAALETLHALGQSAPEAIERHSQDLPALTYKPVSKAVEQTTAESVEELTRAIRTGDEQAYYLARDVIKGTGSLNTLVECLWHQCVRLRRAVQAAVETEQTADAAPFGQPAESPTTAIWGGAVEMLNKVGGEAPEQVAAAIEDLNNVPWWCYDSWTIREQRVGL